MDVPLIGWELTGVPDPGRARSCKAGAVAERPLSPLHPALLLNAYLGWASGKLLFLSGIPVTSIASGRLVTTKQRLP